LPDGLATAYGEGDRTPGDESSGRVLDLEEAAERAVTSMTPSRFSSSYRRSETNSLRRVWYPFPRRAARALTRVSVLSSKRMAIGRVLGRGGGRCESASEVIWPSSSSLSSWVDQYADSSASDVKGGTSVQLRTVVMRHYPVGIEDGLLSLLGLDAMPANVSCVVVIPIEQSQSSPSDLVYTMVVPAPGTPAERKARRLTKEQVDALAAEAESGYDLSKAARETVRPGRPSLDTGVSPRISYRVAGSLYARAKAKVSAEGRTVSEIAREALERYVGG
jgi:hypothetical protein